MKNENIPHVRTPGFPAASRAAVALSAAAQERGEAMLLRRAATRLLLRAGGAPARAPRALAATRFLSSSPPGGRRQPPTLSPREQKLNSDLEEIFSEFQKRLDYSAEPQLRGPPPPPPKHISESWAPAALVSPVLAENALNFRTRFYIDSTGQQQYHSVKVQLNVKIRRLGLSAAEEARLLAVARPHYRKNGHELVLACSRYLEVPRNKAHLRETVSKLLADARANAEAHEATPDAEKPLAARQEPWLAGDRRAFRRRPPTYHKNMHKSPG